MAPSPMLSDGRSSERASCTGEHAGRREKDQLARQTGDEKRRCKPLVAWRPSRRDDESGGQAEAADDQSRQISAAQIDTLTSVTTTASREKQRA